MRETRIRSIVKALTYRTTMFIIATAIAYHLTGSFDKSVAVAAVYFVGAAIVYYIYERIWDRVEWGRLGYDMSLMLGGDSMGIVITYERKVYKVSSDSWALTVPREWVDAARSRGIVTDKGGVLVKVHVLSDGNLLVEPVVPK